MQQPEERCANKYRYCAADIELRFVEPAVATMLADKRTIAWSTFRRKVCLDDLMEIFPFYKWHSGRCLAGQLHIKDDPNVHFYRSRFSGCPCYLILHDETAFIFLPTEAIIQLRLVVEHTRE